MRRIGVMGGMFDPVHKGHVAVALTALHELMLDELRLVPCYRPNPNHRGPASESAAERLAMLDIAARVDARLVVDDRECLRSGVSYTVDTLQSLRREFPEDALVLVMGADAFASFDRWHRWRDILDLAHVVVISRPGSELGPPAGLDDELARELIHEIRQRQVASVVDLFRRQQGNILLLTDLQLDISSTQVREKLRHHGDMATLLPEEVARYIETRGLYGAGTASD